MRKVAGKTEKVMDPSVDKDEQIFAAKEFPKVKDVNPLTTSRTRKFLLKRTEDETGISGIGVVAEGIEFSNGMCAMSWLTAMHSVAVYPNIKALEAIHGHNGRTFVVWVLS